MGEHISLGICVSHVGEHISLGICVSHIGEHISLGICVSDVGEHILLGICVCKVGEQMEGPNALDQMSLRVFRLFLVEVQTNAGYIYVTHA